MKIPEDLQMSYNRYLDLASRNVERTTVSPEIMLALIERIAQLETDCKNPNSYIHQFCKNANDKKLIPNISLNTQEFPTDRGRT